MPKPPTTFSRLGSDTEVFYPVYGVAGARTGGAYAAAKFGNGFQITGNTQYIEYTGLLNKDIGSASFFLIPNFNSADSGTYATLSYTNSNSGPGIHFVRSANLWRFLWIGGTGTNLLDINESFSASDVLHIGLSWNSSGIGGSGETYAQVKNLTTGTVVSGYGDYVPSAAASNANSRLGNRYNDNNYFNGKIDNLKIFDYNITDFSPYWYSERGGLDDQVL